MTLPWHRRLLEATGLAPSELGKPAKLAAMAAHVHRVLDRLMPQGGPTPPGSDSPLGLRAGLPLVDGMNIPGLDVFRRSPGSATRPASSMLARVFASETGTRPYRLFVPSHLPIQPAVLVMLHGCTQSPEDFALGTRMNIFAEQRGFLVIYPEQTQAANPQRCWNWFNPTDQARGKGEPALIAGMVHAVLAEFGADPKRIFVAGLSAGGAQAAILGATYPDLFAAIGVHSGLACGAAHDVASAFTAMRKGRPGQGHLHVPAIIFHGDRDGTVNPGNADALAAQLDGLTAPKIENGKSPGGLTYTRTVRFPMLEQWVIHGAGHAWSGGDAMGSFTEPKGPDASAEMLRFFKL